MSIPSPNMWVVEYGESVGVIPISTAILWTHFVTPHEDQTQQDQTRQLSYHKKEQSEELKDNQVIQAQ